MADEDLIKQVWLKDGEVKNASLIGPKDYVNELRQYRTSLHASCRKWPSGYDLAASPLPILVPEDFKKDLERLSDILSRSVISIVSRWWTDSNFSGRMPVKPYQEEILRVRTRLS